MKTFALFRMTVPIHGRGGHQIFVTVIRADDLSGAARKIGGGIKRAPKGSDGHASRFRKRNAALFIPGETTKHVIPDDHYVHAAPSSPLDGEIWLGEVSVIE